MESSPTANTDPALPDGPDRLRVRRWLAAHAVYILALVVAAILLLSSAGVSWQSVLRHPIQTTEDAAAGPKLLLFCAYISLCCTFLPLPANAMVSAVSMQTFAPFPGSILATTAIVAAVGAWASMMANLLDFHLFTLVLRHKGIARVRHTRLYDKAARWFSRQPFLILIVFNILPIPIDVVRMLAATARYPLKPFAAANFIGRFFRYAVLASITFALKEQGWVAPLVLLGVAAALALPKLVGRRIRRGEESGIDPAKNGKM